MDNIKRYLNTLDHKQVDEATKIAEQLRDYDTSNYTAEAVPLQHELPPEEDFTLYKQLVNETGISDIYDFFESPMTYINSTMLQQLTRDTPDINKSIEKTQPEPQPIQDTNPTYPSRETIHEISSYPNRKDWLLDLEPPIDFMLSTRINSLYSLESSTNRGELQPIGEIQIPKIEELTIQEIELSDTGNNNKKKKQKSINSHTAKALTKIQQISDNLKQLMEQPTYKVPQLLEHNTLQLDSIKVSKNKQMEKRSTSWKKKGRISKQPFDKPENNKASNPTTEDYKMLTHCIEYIKKHPATGLTYVRGKTAYLGPDFVVYGYADASFAPPDNRKSVSGYCTYINGNLVQWGTKKQRCVTNSSMASEIIALGEAVSRASLVISILKSLNLPHKKLLIFEDNQPTIKVVTNRKTSSKRRTIDTTMEVLRNLINEAKEVDITYINTHANLADGFTKALGIKKFTQLTQLLFDDGNLQQISHEIVARLYGNTRDSSVIYNMLWGRQIDWNVVYMVMGIRGETQFGED